MIPEKTKLSPALQSVTAEHLELLAMPSVMDSFPLAFEAFTWQKLDVICPQCETIIDPEKVRGRVDGSFPNVILIEAVATCSNCQLSMPVSHRLYADGRHGGLKDGKWLEWRPKISFWRKMVNSIRLWR